MSWVTYKVLSTFNFGNEDVGSMINWMLYNIEPACSGDAPEERDTAIKEVNSTVLMIERLNMLIPTLLKIHE